MASPPRSQFYDVALDITSASATFGKPVSTTKVTVYAAVPQAATPQTTLASIFSAESGAGTPGNPFFATTGEINFWVGTGTYDIKIEDTATPAKFATRIVRFDGDPYDKGMTNAMVADGAIDSRTIQDGTIVASDLSAAVQALLVPAGTILPYAGTNNPSGYLLCNGATVATGTYPNLDALFGPSGAVPHAFNNGVSPGAGLTKLPDLRGRVPLGVGTGTAAGASAWALGNSGTTPITGAGGEQTHTLLAAESGMPAHNPSVSVSASQAAHQHNVLTGNAGGNSPFGNGIQLLSGSSLNTGGNAAAFQFANNGSFAYQFYTDQQTPTITASATASVGAQNAASGHNIMQPHTVVGYIIKT
jgi:microcystin-dependent protein